MLQQIYESTKSFEKNIKKAERKSKGQFFTHIKVAEFMASLSLNVSQELRILDCGAGTGILACALLDQLIKNVLVKKVVLDLYEDDNVVLTILKENLELISSKYRENNIELIVNIIEKNFITANKETWENKEFEGIYDIIIANPPYRKLAKDSDESQAMLSIVYGQPNIYFLFMAMSTKLLRQGGEMIFITPRSFTSGAYFKAFRQYWLNEIVITNIHIFTSRTDVFNKEEVLQEAIITRAIKNIKKNINIEITASNDTDFEHSERFNVDYNTVVDLSTENKYILIPSALEEVRVLENVHKWNCNLPKLGFKLKTGPVVDFRSREWIKEKSEDTTVPLLYAGHYDNYYINFPLEKYKDYQYIVNIPETQYLMLDNKNYLLIKRLTAKEETRRLQCAIYLSESYPQYQKIGIENHINYLAKLNGEITQEELYGMFCLFNSSTLDIYYRIMNGNTQVNATEVNAIPLPDLDTICQFGRELMTINSISTENCDRIVNEIINKGGIKMGKLEEARRILEDLKLPKGQQNDRSAYTLLSLLNLKEDMEWSDSENNLIGIHEIIVFVGENYGLAYAENSRESIRRQTIHQFEQAGLIERNRDNPQRPTNSGKTVYSITDEALEVLKTFGTDEWIEKCNEFLYIKEPLAEKYKKKRDIYKVAVDLGETILEFSAGYHNDLQKAIIEEFGARFAQNSKLLYVGDTANKQLHILDEDLERLGIPMTQHDKLPDVVLYNEEKNWLYLCEAVTTHGPVSPKRFIELEEMLKDCNCGKIYVSCFPDRDTFKKYFTDIAWETEVWLSNEPDHMIHLNGDRFMGPR